MRSTSTSDEGSDENVDETNESAKQKKFREFFLEDNLTTSCLKIHVCSGHQNDSTVIIGPF